MTDYPTWLWILASTPALITGSLLLSLAVIRMLAPRLLYSQPLRHRSTAPDLTSPHLQTTDRHEN